MRFFTLFGLLFNTVFFIMIALLLFGFVFDVITPSILYDNLILIQQNPHSRLILSLAGFLIVFISISFAQSVLGKMQREKNIAFPTPSGEVSIALSAVEDLIRRLVLQAPEIKTLRPDVIVTKKGIIVNLRIDLRSEANIPDLTERLQEMIKNKIRDMLRGIDEPILVKIHVAKIVSSEDNKKKEEPADTEPTIPFYGYHH